MKRLTATMAIVVFLLFSFSASAEWSGQAKIYKTIPSDVENIVQTSTGIQIQTIHEETGLYPYLSYEVIPIRFGGQRGADIPLWGLGVGIKRPIANQFNVFCQIGWFQPKWEKDGESQILWKDHVAEGLAFYLNNKLECVWWDAYSLEYHGNIGGIMGADFILPLSDNVDFNMFGAYRYLKLQEMIKAYHVPWDGGWWEYKQDRDFSGWQAGLGIEVKF